jgi:branched-chain amino acid transport system ATP-binding protein
MAGPLLALDQVTTYYGQMRILEGISLEVNPGELVCLLGGNASGKSTTLKTVLGIVRPRAGAVVLDGEDVTARSVPERIARGMAIVPENRRLFGDMTVRENLELGATLRRGEDLSEDFERVHSLFPRVYERRNQLAGTLSGGEQQMVAMGRALMSRPRLLLVDEASLGLSPALTQTVFSVVDRINDDGVTVVLVEQNVGVLPYADRALIMEKGTLVYQGSGDEIHSGSLRETYLGTPA